MAEKYKVLIAASAKLDIAEKKRYIIKEFKYREYADNYVSKIKKAVKHLDVFPKGYDSTGFWYRGYKIYFKPAYSHIIFFIVDDTKRTVTVLRVLQDGMDWEYILHRWIRESQG
jgi:plasmid stabilization system protein ParE